MQQRQTSHTRQAPVLHCTAERVSGACDCSTFCCGAWVGVQHRSLRTRGLLAPPAAHPPSPDACRARPPLRASLAFSQLVAKRPVSPHVFEITGVQPHYKFPLGAISSITNRATGCMLSAGAPTFCLWVEACWLACCVPACSPIWWDTLRARCVAGTAAGAGAAPAGAPGVAVPPLPSLCSCCLRPPSALAALPRRWPVGTAAAAYIALTGDLGAGIAAFKDGYPLLVFPAKAVAAFPLVGGWAGGRGGALDAPFVGAAAAAAAGAVT